MNLEELNNIYNELINIDSDLASYFDNLESNLDSIDWITLSPTITYSTDGVNYVSSGTINSQKLYVKITGVNPPLSSVYRLGLSFRTNSGNYRNTINLTGVYSAGGSFNNIDQYKVYPVFSRTFAVYYISGAILDGTVLEFSSTSSGSGYNIYTTNLNPSFSSLSDNNVDSWLILNAMDNYYLSNQISDIYSLLNNYFNGASVPGSIASQAADELGSQAAAEAAAHATVAALSPGSYQDFDEAVRDFDLLDNIALSTAFWVNATNAFEQSSGIIWGIIVFGLLIGLVTFILRLR